jgi:glucose-1-phosphate adenylyltransferase
MDFREMVRGHRKAGADVSIAAMPVSRTDATGLGIMKADDSGKVIGFVEKPTTDEQLDSVHVDAKWFAARNVESRGRSCLASMGIYLFNRDLLVDIMTSTNHEDFGREVFPQSIHDRHVQVHLFDDYWEDIGTIRAFYDANLSLAQREPPFQLASPEAPVYSRARYLPPTRVEGATIKRSLLADGCQIEEGTIIENSIVGLRCIIGRGVTIKNSILMGADYYEDQNGSKGGRPADRPRISIDEGTLIDGAIIDKNCYIGRNVRIVNDDSLVDSPDDNDTCVIRDGIPVVLKGASLPDDWKL